MVYATLQDLRDGYEETIPDGLITWATTQLAVANTLLDVRVPSLAGRVADPTTGPTLAILARQAVVTAVLRLLRNPAGYKGEHGGEYSYYYGSDATLGRVDFTGDDLADLRPSGRSRFSSVALDDDGLVRPTRRRLTRQDAVTEDSTILFNHGQQGNTDTDGW